VLFSDHKPVRCGLELRVKTVRDADRRKYLDQAMKEADKYVNEALPQVSLTTNDVSLSLTQTRTQIDSAVELRRSKVSGTDCA
jgi:hypothetical protein